MAGVQTEKLALQMTVGFHGQLAGLAGWLPQPVHYTTTQHYTHIPLQNTAQYYMHILYTVLFWANQLQFDTSWKFIDEFLCGF